MTAITITLQVSELVYDIQNKTYLTGKSRREGNNHEQVANMQANDDDENANQILRSVGMAFARLRTQLAEYLETEGSSAGNELMAMTDNLTLSLHMPSNYNRSTVTTIAEAAHQYVVAMAVNDWFTITNKADAADYGALAAQSLAVISEAAHRRLRPKRKKE